MAALERAHPPIEGQLLPAFVLPAAGSGEVRVRAYRGRRSLCLIFIHGGACPACRAFLSEALAHYAAYADEDGEVIAVTPNGEDAAAIMRADLALPFPVAVDAAGTVFRRYGLTPGAAAAVLLTDRYGAPRLWQVAPPDHSLPEHERLIAELRFLALTCSAGCAVPVWDEPES